MHVITLIKGEKIVKLIYQPEFKLFTFFTVGRLKRKDYNNQRKVENILVKLLQRGFLDKEIWGFKNINS